MKIEITTTLLVLFSSFLVFFMQAGFSILTAGFIRSKNALSILAGSFSDFCVGSIAFFVLGYGLMFGGGDLFYSIFGVDGFFLINAKPPEAPIPLELFWFFHATFCAATATIAAGAMAGRAKFSAYLIFTTIICAIIYPVSGHWVWGGGFLQALGFYDFAGSAQVHLLGGVIAFWGAWFLGPRNGKFDKLGRPKIISGHSIPLAVLGTFILWFGWFGFNAGSLMSTGDLGSLAIVIMNTHLAGCAGSVSALMLSWIRFKKPDITLALNGGLAGLVSITAVCNLTEPIVSVLIGAIGGVIVFFSIPLFDKTKIDDPLGAVSVHGLAGLWGVIAVGLFANGEEITGLFWGGGLKLLSTQIIGVFSIIMWGSVAILIAMVLINKLIGFRISPEAELRGLDIEEFGNEAYNDFQIFSH